MKSVKQYSADEERLLLAALITSDPVLEQVALSLKGESEPFRSRSSNLIASWCFAYFEKYKRAPRRAIKRLFSRFAESSRDNETIELIESFLGGLSDEFQDEVNVDFAVDMASRYFRRIRLEKLHEQLDACLEQGDVDEAEALLKGYDPVTFGTSDWIDPTSSEVLHDALDHIDGESLVSFRGDLGRFLSPHFERDGFICFVGPEKRGKSYWLMETAWTAWRQRRRVLYYVIGDMSRRQVMRRFIVRALRRPLRAMQVDRPVSIEKLARDRVQVKSRAFNYTEPVSLHEAKRRLDLVLKKTSAVHSRLKLKCIGGSVVSASSIERDIQMFARQGWVPDVVVTDYADLLLPEPHTRTQEPRHQINESFKTMRRISQDHHLLFVTATQASAAAYGANVIRKSDFSEDKRKNAHVTGMLGINQNSDEKIQGIYRLNWVFLRDGSWTDTQVVWTAGNLALACPCIVSTL